MRKLMHWFFGHYDLEFCLTPISIDNRVRRIEGGLVGWTNVRIFGLRVLYIQRTRPWED